jgi:hypothetical protein
VRRKNYFCRDDINQQGQLLLCFLHVTKDCKVKFPVKFAAYLLKCCYPDTCAAKRNIGRLVKSGILAYEWPDVISLAPEVSFDHPIHTFDAWLWFPSWLVPHLATAPSDAVTEARVLELHQFREVVLALLPPLDGAIFQRVWFGRDSGREDLTLATLADDIGSLHYNLDEFHERASIMIEAGALELVPSVPLKDAFSANTPVRVCLPHYLQPVLL